MVTSMIALDPVNRLTAKQYLEEQKGKAFPVCFDSFLLQYVQKILKEFSPDFVTYKYVRDPRSTQPSTSSLFLGCIETFPTS